MLPYYGLTSRSAAATKTCSQVGIYRYIVFPLRSLDIPKQMLYEATKADDVDDLCEQVAGTSITRISDEETGGTPPHSDGEPRESSTGSSAKTVSSSDHYTPPGSGNVPMNDFDRKGFTPKYAKPQDFKFHEDFVAFMKKDIADIGTKCKTDFDTLLPKVTKPANGDELKGFKVSFTTSLSLDCSGGCSSNSSNIDASSKRQSACESG